MGRSDEGENLVIVRCFENDEDVDDKSITDFQFIDKERIISGTNEGDLMIHSLLNVEEALCSVNIHANSNLGVDSIIVSSDAKMAAVIGSTEGSSGEKEFTLYIYTIQAASLTIKGQAILCKNISLPNLVSFTKSENGYLLTSTTSEKNV